MAGDSNYNTYRPPLFVDAELSNADADDDDYDDDDDDKRLTLFTWGCLWGNFHTRLRCILVDYKVN